MSMQETTLKEHTIKSRNYYEWPLAGIISFLNQSAQCSEDPRRRSPSLQPGWGAGCRGESTAVGRNQSDMKPGEGSLKGFEGEA